ncbi:MAG: HAMP domain-containing protein [Coriobacteriia bacterium]|nr:HAMP domain-containing protein [Coriobacteriia bacterium]
MAVAIAVTTTGVLFTGLRDVDVTIARNDAAATALNQLFELSMLTTDYLIYYEPRAERQWEDKHAKLDEVLGGLSVGSPEEETILLRVRENNVEAEHLFGEITEAHRRGDSGEVDPAVSRESEIRLTARLLIVMQSMVTDSVRLGEYASAAAMEAQRRTTSLVLAIALGSITVMAVIGVSTSRTVVRPIERLRANVREVGAGNLSVRSDVSGDDEVGELASAFDAMVADLQGSYTRLESEIAERRHAEMELSQYRDHLEQLVDERTEELLRLNEELVEATRAKDDFLASMSHELRTPLNSIIGFTEIMLRGLAGDVTDEQQRQLGMVRDSGQQLLLLVDDVLDLARINAGHVTVVSAEMSVPETVERLAEMMRPLTDTKGLRLALSFKDGAPTTIVSDRGKVDQIMLNLLANAVTYTDQGSITMVVRAESDRFLALEVHDTGLGIPEAELESVFEQFHRAHREIAATHPGTGLGLSISRRLAEALGGRLDARSAVGEGSVFTLVLPIAGPTSSPEPRSFVGEEPDSRE